MATTEELQARLTEAEQAYHKLMVGKSNRVIQYDGRRLENTAANQQMLSRYIAELKRQIAGVPARRGSIRYVVPC